MTDGVVQIAPDGLGKKVDVSEMPVGGNIVERQRVNISSPSDPNGHAEVSNEPLPNPDSMYALLVRQIAEDNAYTQELLSQIASVLSNLALPGTVAGGTFFKGLQVAQTNSHGLCADAYLTMAGGTALLAQSTNNPWQTPSIPVTLNSNFPANNLPPQHIYGGITV